MLRYRFRLDIFDGTEKVLMGHITPIHEFKDPTVLANTLLNNQGFGLRAKFGMANGPVDNAKVSHIELPPAPNGYGPDTTVWIREAIPVESA